MYRSYLKIAWRSITGSKGYSLLNILGLATGMAVALIIGLWVHFEYSFDKFLPDYSQLYQVRRNFNSNGDTLNFTSTSLKLATALRQQIPEIEYVAESRGMYEHVLKVGDKKFNIRGGIINGDFLKMFQYPLVQGNANQVLKDPYSIVLTQSAAKILFGERDALNQFVRFDNKNDLKVTGILKDVPENSSFQFGFLVPFSYVEQIDSSIKQYRSASFSENGFELYAKLRPGISYAQVAPKIRDIEKTETDNRNAMNSNVVMQSLKNWHLYSTYENGKDTGGFIEYVRLFSIIGALVLLIACINFINLTTARSERRAKEVGVRKAIGSARVDLILQFLIESILITFIAFSFSLLFVQLALPAFNALTGTRISIPYDRLYFWIGMLAGVLLTALAAGCRPAFYLSSFNPIKVLKGSGSTGKTGSLPRKILVVAQFSCSIALIISTIIVYQQIQYARNRPAGYDINRLMVTFMSDDLIQNYVPLKNDLLQRHLVESVTTATSPVTDIYWHSDIDKWPGKYAGETVEMGTLLVTTDYFKTLGIPLKTGRDFIGASDTTSVIFNEAAIRRLRLQEPIGQTITWSGTPLKIIGVAKDAIMMSPFAMAEPTLFYCTPGPRNIMMYRLSPSINTQEAIAQLRVLFNKYDPSSPYSFSFADADYAKKFDLEVLVGKLAGLFAGLAIFISCLGLFGLAAYMASQRNKEIGIRKVLGASVSQMWLLLSQDFIVLVLISCLIASPVALYLLRRWLQKYPYHIGIGPGVFVAAGIIALVITLMTISFQSIKAALANPVKSLRSE